MEKVVGGGDIGVTKSLLLGVGWGGGAPGEHS